MAAPSTDVQTRDLIVIGCSAGGLDALGRIVRQLPRDLPASVVIVQHISPTHDPYLVTILQRDSPLPVSWVEQGAPLGRGQIFVAPPDAHTLITDSHLGLSRGPRENHSRPSIDKLFRSAAATHGTRVIGVLLTGMLHDGVAGLLAIQEAGGHTIVQDPGTAAYPELPNHALSVMTPERVLGIDEIARELIAIAGQPVPSNVVPPKLVLEAEIDANGAVDPDGLAALGRQTPISCPDCQGPTWQILDAHPPRFRCYLGHAHTARDVLEAGSTQVETALWSAIRALNDRALTFEMLAEDAMRAGQPQTAEDYAARGRETRKNADVARQFMQDLTRVADPA
jgi:two-component system chemotaxis response regulator CheB